MSPSQRGNVNFQYFLAVLVKVNSGQVGCSNSLWWLSYRRLAGFSVSNLRFNGAFGQIPAVFCFHHAFETPRLGHDFIDDPLETTVGEARGYN